MPRNTASPREEKHRPAPSRNLNSTSRILSRKPSSHSNSKVYNTFAPNKKRNMDHQLQVKKEKGFFARTFPVPALLSFSFWMFGTLVTMQFGVVLTAANDLVGNSAPPGLILFAYTLPSVLVRTFVPYIKFPNVSDLFSFISPTRTSDHWSARTPGGINTPGTPGHVLRSSNVSQEINYAARLTVSAASSFIGLQLLAWADNVGVRMLGIALASLSSNLGDMSFYQLATRYPTMIARSFGGYAAGSGAAGLMGSFTYTILTSSFGVTPSAVLSGIGLAPTLMLLTYFFVLPSPKVVEEAAFADGKDDDIPMEEVGGQDKGKLISDLKLGDKLRLVRPMVIGYMAPLAILMFLENITTQGILPTVLYYLPFSEEFTSGAGVLNTLFKSIRDFYPFFFTVYQFAIFFGRTSITLFRLPGGNIGSSAAYWTLCLVEVGLFLSLLNQSWSMVAPHFAGIISANPDANVLFSPFVVMALIFTMGLCGGLGMSNTYWRVSKKPLPESVWQALDKARSKRLRQNKRTLDTQEDGIATPADGEGEDSYFVPRPRLRKLLPSRSYVGESQTASLLGSHAASVAGSSQESLVRRSQEEETAVREFLISTIALPDTLAIMLASIVSMWLQPELCRWQVERGGGGCVRLE